MTNERLRRRKVPVVDCVAHSWAFPVCMTLSASAIAGSIAHYGAAQRRW